MTKTMHRTPLPGKIYKVNSACTVKIMDWKRGGDVVVVRTCSGSWLDLTVEGNTFTLIERHLQNDPTIWDKTNVSLTTKYGE